MSCGAELEANALMTSLTSGTNFTVPDVDLSGPEYQLPTPNTDLTDKIKRLTNDDLTTRTVGGDGTFDALMAGFAAHLDKEYKANRITGAEYTKAFIALTDGAMGNATQYLLGRDQAYWQAVTAQQQALLAEVQVVTARIQMQTAKVQLASLQMEALNNKANYALTKMKLATESVQYCSAQFTLTNILPQQQRLVTEQAEAAHAQTSDLRTDGQRVAGTLGKQRDLYDQQITSYKRDAEVKAGKLFTDAWTVQKTIDEGLVPPSGFTNASIDTVLTAIKANNNLG